MFNAILSLFYRYTCDAESLRVDQPAIEFFFKSGTRNNQVLALKIKQGETRYLPNNIGKLFPNLKLLSVTGTKLEFVSRDNFENMNSVKVLHLTSSLIKEIPYEAFSPLGNLDVIYLQSNKLKSLHVKTFDKNPKLRDVFAAKNQIERLERGLFTKNLNLVGIHFDQNRIKNILIDIDRSRRYTRINFDHNVCTTQIYPDRIDLPGMIQEISRSCRSVYYTV